MFEGRKVEMKIALVAAAVLFGVSPTFAQNMEVIEIGKAPSAESSTSTFSRAEPMAGPFPTLQPARPAAGALPQAPTEGRPFTASAQEHSPGGTTLRRLFSGN
jgi:hypothetical protein